MTAPAPITQSTAELLREMREPAPTLADTLSQCRDALKLMDATYVRVWDRTDGALICMPESVPAFEAAHAAVAAALAAADAAQPPADERAAFEAWVWKDSTLSVNRDGGSYENMSTALLWHAWQARASLAQPPAAPAVAPVNDEAERTAFYAAYRDHTNGTGHPPSLFDVWLLARGLMTADGRQAAPAVAGEVAMPEPVGAVIPEGSTEYADCVTLAQCRAYGDAREAAERDRCAKLCHEYAAQIPITDLQRYTAGQLAAAINARAHVAASGKPTQQELRDKFSGWEAPELSGKGASQALARVPGWQPIETAPKDADVLLLVGVAIGAPLAVQGCWHHDDEAGESGWIDFGGYVLRPTHWMPLPAAPTAPAPKEKP